MKNMTGAAVVALSLAACTPGQVASGSLAVEQAAAKAQALAIAVDPALVSACTAANNLADLGSLVPQVAAVTPWVKAGCTITEGLVKLAGDNSSLQWVSDLISKMAAYIPQKT